MRKAFFASLVLAILFLTAFAVPSLAQSPAGVIEGQVINGTEGGQVPADMQITVQGFNQSDPLEATQVQADADGKFRVEGLETGADYTYFLYTAYAGLQYNTGLLTFDEGQDTIETSLPIYETTTSDENISLGRAHLVVSFVDGALDVTEVQLFSNGGDRTYIGPETADGETPLTVRFNVPDGATDVSFQDTVEGFDRFVQVEGGYADTAPVIPGDGTLQVTFSYLLPYDAAGTTLTHTLMYRAAALNAFVSDAGVDISSDQLATMGTMGAGDQAYVGFVGQDFAKGDIVSLDLKGSPRVTTTTTEAVANSNGLPTSGYLLIVGGLVVILVALALWYTSQRRRAPVAVRADAEGSEDEIDELMMAIADLDDAYEAGELNEEVYRMRRQALKVRLLELERRG